MELNPNHPVTSKVHDEWYKIAAILVNRETNGRTLITMEEVKRLSGKVITIRDTPAGIELRIVSMVEGERLAKEEGGLPV
jgi:hypothetical protein